MTIETLMDDDRFWLPRHCPVRGHKALRLIDQLTAALAQERSDREALVEQAALLKRERDEARVELQQSRTRAESWQRGHDYAGLGQALDQITDAFRKSTDEWSADAQTARAEIARLKEALTAAEREWEEATRAFADAHRDAQKRAEAAEQKLAHMQEAQKLTLAERDAAEARCQELEATKAGIAEAVSIMYAILKSRRGPRREIHDRAEAWLARREGNR